MGYTFENLKLGKRFGFEYLAGQVEETDAYLKWWWESVARDDELMRPYTIDDNDPIMRPTNTLDTVDTESYSDGFWHYLQILLGNRSLRRGPNVPRHAYRQSIIDHFVSGLPKLDKPTVVFAGGGYGSGKTTVLTFLGKQGLIPNGMAGLRGVDHCKMLLPEFERIKMVGDGRASSVCQSEARMISEALFQRIVETKASFAWDSSMSNRDETLAKVGAARDCGYELQLVAVWAPVEVAVRRAMSRAKETKRFAHPEHLAGSVKGFARHFEEYVDRFDSVQLYDNSAQGDPEVAQPLLIAKKECAEKELEVFDEAALNSMLHFGNEP